MVWYIIGGIISLVFLWGTTCEYIKTIKGKIKAAKESRHYYMGDDGRHRYICMRDIVLQRRLLGRLGNNVYIYDYLCILEYYLYN